MTTPTKFQNPSSKFQGNAINQGKGQKRKENRIYFVFIGILLFLGIWILELGIS